MAENNQKLYLTYKVLKHKLGLNYKSLEILFFKQEQKNVCGVIFIRFFCSTYFVQKSYRKYKKVTF